MDNNKIKIKYVEASKTDLEKGKQIEMFYKYSPHVVILGAGASKACIPNGDKNGLNTPCMDEFFEIEFFKDLLDGVSLETKSRNLEIVYSEIYEKSLVYKKYRKIRDKLEKRIRDYFSKFQLPDTPTIYDYLIMSLTNKDLIASFNWDPLLAQSYGRVANMLGGVECLPKIAFLHGNVGIEIDNNSKRVNIKTSPYAECYPGFENLKLLYPIKKKNYSNDLFIKNQWEMVRDFIKRAYIFTIFGYGAPDSDVESIKLLKKAWGDTNKKWANEIEIINIEDSNISYQKWKPFIYQSHYQCHTNFFESFIAEHPRRSTESMFDVTMNVIWGKPSNFLKSKPSLEEFYEFLKPLILDEMVKCDKSEARTNIYSNLITPFSHK